MIFQFSVNCGSMILNLNVNLDSKSTSYYIHCFDTDNTLTRYKMYFLLYAFAYRYLNIIQNKLINIIHNTTVCIEGIKHITVL